MPKSKHVRFLPFALGRVFLEHFLTLGSDPLLLENFHFLRQMSLNCAEEVFVHDRFGGFKSLLDIKLKKIDKFDENVKCQKSLGMIRNRIFGSLRKFLEFFLKLSKSFGSSLIRQLKFCENSSFFIDLDKWVPGYPFLGLSTRCPFFLIPR